MNHNKDSEFEADILFQRIFDKWYAFSVVNEDCFITKVTEKEIQKRLCVRALKNVA